MTQELRCPGCNAVISDDCQDCKKCETKGCNGFVHPLSEHGQCAGCEIDGAREELRLRWLENTHDYAYTAAAEVVVRQWEQLANPSTPHEEVKR
jgi:hypothetical protein